MTMKKMARYEEQDFYARPANQEPQGAARRRRPKLTEVVPVRFPPEPWRRSDARREPTTARCRAGSVAPSSTNSTSTRPDHSCGGADEESPAAPPATSVLAADTACHGRSMS